MLLTCEDAKFLGFSEFLRRGVRPDQPRPGRGARRHTRQAKAHSLNSIHRAPRDSTGCGRRTGQPGDWTCRFARVRPQRGVANCAHRVASYRPQWASTVRGRRRFADDAEVRHCRGYSRVRRNVVRRRRCCGSSPTCCKAPPAGPAATAGEGPSLGWFGDLGRGW